MTRVTYTTRKGNVVSSFAQARAEGIVEVNYTPVIKPVPKMGKKREASRVKAIKP